MSVISRDRAEEFHLVKSAPRRTSAYPVRLGTAHGIEHQCQTRVSVHHDILGRRVHHRTHELFRLLDPGQELLRGARTEARKELKTGDRELLQAAMTKIFMGSGSKK